MRILIKSLLAILLLSFLIGTAYLYWVGTSHLKPTANSYVVIPGTSLRAFSRQLYQQRVLSDPYSLVLIAHMKGRSHGLKAGEYRFRAGITPLELLDQVLAGRVVEYPLLIVEGWTFFQVMEAINNAPKLTHTLENFTPKQIMTKLGYPNINPEGRFYPDTYFYSLGTSDAMLLHHAYRKMDTFLQKEWVARDPSIPLKTPEEALTLASIVEKESAHADERRLIAGVFLHRLQLGMRLQTDPTVIYGMGNRYHGNIHLQDLRHDTPYNTYTRFGLPPTPIAMPGGDSIHAALNPAQTSALYFVSRGDGSHVFSDTLQEHNNAVIKYQLGGKPKTFSSSATSSKHSKPKHKTSPKNSVRSKKQDSQ